MSVYRIVLTGGPGGGKSTIIEEIKKRYAKKGKTRVITVNETASIMADDELKPTECDDAFAFQNEVYNIQKTREEAADNLASHFPEKNIIIVYDRGILDNRAYLNKGEFETILYNHQDNEMEILDKYDLVINLMTAAHLEGKYLKETNPHRTEDPDFARELDKKTLDSWLFHRNIYNVEATDEFEGKINRVMDIIKENINKSKRTSIFLESYKDSRLKKYIDDNNLKSLYVQDYYLINNDKKKIIVSKRMLRNDVSYLYKELNLSDDGYTKTEYPLKESDVIKLFCLHPPKDRVESNIYRFVYENQIFEITHNFTDYTIELINKDPNKELEIPDNLFLLEDVEEKNVQNSKTNYYRARYLK